MSELYTMLDKKYELFTQLLHITKSMIEISSEDADVFESEISKRQDLIKEIDSLNKKIDNFDEKYNSYDEIVIKINQIIKETIAYDNLLVPNISRKIRELRKKHDGVKEQLDTEKLDFSAEKKDKGYFLNIKG